VPYHTNEEFGLKNPLASVRPDLATMTINGSQDVGDNITFGTFANDIRDVQNTFTYADTLSFTKGQHSIRLGGEFRRHQLNGALRELKNGRKNFRGWMGFMTVGFVDPGDGNRARQISDTATNYGETIRGYRMSDYSFFAAEDWKVNSKLTLNLGLRWEYFGFPSEVNGFLNVYDYNAALATGKPEDGFLMASNFNPASIAGAAQSNLKKASTPSIISGDRNNFMPRLGFAWSPLAGSRLILRGGYGIFYERTTGAFANSLRQSSPFFRESQINDQNTYHTWAPDFPVFPIPRIVVGFSSAGVPRIERADVPGVTFEAFESQMVDPNLATPYTQQWNLNVQWEFKPNWMWEIGYAGTKGTKLLQIYNINRSLDIDAIGGFLARPGVPGGGLTGNYYGPSSGGVFVNLKTPPPTCNLLVNPRGTCVVNEEVRSPLLGFDEDEGINYLSSNSNSIYNSLQSSLQKRFSQGYMFKVNYTFSRSIDSFSDEGQFQTQHDQLNPALNRGLSDFHRKHRLITSGTWDLPFKGNRLVSGWSVSGIGIVQSGTPFTVRDTCCSGFLYPNSNIRPNMAPGATHDDLATEGPVNSRVSNYLNRSAFVPSGAQFGNLGRNTVFAPDQRRVDLVLSKLTTIREGISLELRGEFFNAFNTVTFREPERTLNTASFGEITRTRGGPRVIQLGLKLRF
jgi:TonB dependent receptor-like, beta-barrel